MWSGNSIIIYVLILTFLLLTIILNGLLTSLYFKTFKLAFGPVSRYIDSKIPNFFFNFTGPIHGRSLTLVDFWINPGPRHTKKNPRYFHRKHSSHGFSAKMTNV